MISIRKELLRLAVPNILANLSIPLLGTVNLAVLAHLDSTSYLAAVSLVGVIFNFILWSFSFLRMSTTGITAQNFGANDRLEISSSLYRSILIAALLGVLIVLLRHQIGWLGFGMLHPDDSLSLIMKEYYDIRIWVVPASLINFVILGWLLGVQDSAAAMMMIIFENVVNVALNLYFVIHLDMKADGVALGTTIAGWGALLFGIVLVLLRHRTIISKFKSDAVFIFSRLMRVLTVNANIFLRSFSLLTVFSWFTYASKLYGNDVLALNTLLLQFFMFFSFFIDGFSYAGESLSGKYLGAGKIRLLRLTVKTLFQWAFGTSLVFSLLYLIGGQWVFGLLTDNQTLLNLALEQRFWVVLIPLASFVAFVWDGIFAGMTHTAAMRNVMLVAVLGVFFPLYFLLENVLPGMNLWIAFLSFFVARSVGMTLAKPEKLKVRKVKSS
ncbi:MAG: MATE family efflux transporter [Bacteroidales bacterium]|jgi:MATE family multidrug resistance protein|nr:MATE family efflux transporter [Bacteroidales bacterium]